jgi:hypothetical protein
VARAAVSTVDPLPAGTAVGDGRWLTIESMRPILAGPLGETNERGNRSPLAAP